MFAFILILITLTLFINSLLTMLVVVKSPNSKTNMSEELLSRIIVIFVVILMASINFDTYQRVIPPNSSFYVFAIVLLAIITALPMCFAVSSFLTLLKESDHSVIGDETTPEMSSSSLSGVPSASDQVATENCSQDNRKWLDKLHNSSMHNQNN